MTTDEILLLLEAAPEERRLLYEVAFLSGLRANELSQLRVSHLDVERCGLDLEAEWTKNRKAGFQPLPRLLITTLCDFVAKGSAGKMYERNYKKGGSKNSLPVDPFCTCHLIPIEC